MAIDQTRINMENYHMHTRINNQLTYIFLCSFAILFTGFGLFPLLPLYAGRYGASHAVAGIYMAIVYISLGSGSTLAGRFTEPRSQKRLFTLAGILGIPALVLLGQATALWHVIVLTSVVWFTGGIGLSIVDVLTGLHTTPSTRGKLFSLISLSSPLSALIGGIVVGWLAQRYGYPTMFLSTAIVWAMWPILAVWKIEYKPTNTTRACAQIGDADLRHNASFTSLLVSVLLASMAVGIGRLGMSFNMQANHYSVHDVSTANAFGGLIAIPITLLIGALSDKVGVKKVVTLGYVIAAFSCLLLLTARDLWQFWLVSVLALNARNITSSMSSALATDLLNRNELGRALPLVGTMNSVASVLGFSLSGFVMDRFGAVTLFSMGAMIALLSVILIRRLPARQKPLQKPTLLEPVHK